MLRNIPLNTLLIGAVLILCTACGGGGSGGGAPPSGSSSSSTSAPATAAAPTLTVQATKTFSFSWTDVSDAGHYKLLENPDGVSGFTQVGADVLQGIQAIAHIVPLHLRLNAQYILQSCNSNGCTDSAVVGIGSNLVEGIGYFKASNSENDDFFGNALAVSRDGRTLAVGAWGENSSATGINGDQANNATPAAGAVYVFSFDNSSWSQQAYIKASNAESGDFFGYSVTLSASGDTLAVSATGEDSNSAIINGNESDNSKASSGAVYIFQRNSSAWTQQAYVKASNSDFSDLFGHALSLSDDGDTLAVGVPSEDSNATAINGNQFNNASPESGATYLFRRNGSLWQQQAYIKPSNTGAGYSFGQAVTLSADGDVLAVGAEVENTATSGGAVYIFRYNGTDWVEEGRIAASNWDGGDFFGSSVSLNSAGDKLAIGAEFESSMASGINGDGSDNSLADSGAVYVFERVWLTIGLVGFWNWSQIAYIKDANPDAGARFGSRVSLSADGNILAVSAERESGNALGLGGDDNNNLANQAGAAYLFRQDTGGNWMQEVYIKAKNTDAGDKFGISLGLSGDGQTLAVGADHEDSDANGINGDVTINTAIKVGAVYLY